MKEQKERKKLIERAKKIRVELFEVANTLSEKYDGAPVVIVVGGLREARVLHCITGWKFPGEKTRLRDIVGVLQTAIQIESLDHLNFSEVKRIAFKHEQILKARR